MWLSFSGEILAYQMRTLSDKRGGMTKGGILTRKENKDMEDGGRDRRMQSAALEATSPELYVGRQGRRLPWAAELPCQRGPGDPLMIHLPPLIHAQKNKGISCGAGQILLRGPNPVDKEFAYPDEI